MAVANISQALPVYTGTLGYVIDSETFNDPVQQASVIFLRDENQMCIELVAPLGPDSHLQRIIARGGGAYHVCYEVPDIHATTADLRRKGWVVMSQPVPAIAFKNRAIAWLYSPTRQLVELVEAARGADSHVSITGDGTG